MICGLLVRIPHKNMTTPLWYLSEDCQNYYIQNKKVAQIYLFDPLPLCFGPSSHSTGRKSFQKSAFCAQKVVCKAKQKSSYCITFRFFSPTDNAAFPVQHNTRAVGSFLDDDGKNDYDGDIGDVDSEDVGDREVVKSPQLKAKRTRR